jgi:hypothetical protein
MTIGHLLIIIGLAIALVGVLMLVLGPDIPGNIRITGSNFTCFIPIASMILISIILTIVLNIIVRLINRP